ncbi:prolipoprotein diacylglyceryl transferase [Gordonia hydrophobica]|uniref:Phosphatidylglycerol--prolipoprotein diacylglyceryl transferase n=1 Tax=Gordonia hydrophobica TaxID=40516 RepID=A0ABZ2TYP9_9ACTN|nr:prolipoprotein diacylglyceryl transferase [Gordonia hydrophobica]
MTDGTVLAYIPSPSQGVWHLGPVPIRAYALCIIVGIVVAVWWGSRRWQARGGQPGEVIDVALWAVPFGLVGGRLYHVLTDWETYFGPGGKGLGAAFQVWEGGLGIWGAVAFGALGAWIGARNMGIKLPPFGDAIAPAILLAQAIGRLGNYFNQELFGRPTEVPWGLEIYDRVSDQGQVSFKLIDGVSNGHVVAIVHPTFLYEMIWNVLIVIALVLIDRKFSVGHGRLFAMYVAGYCVGRFGIELMRDDFATHIFGVRINVFTSAIVFLCAALYVVMAPKGREQGLTMYWPDRAEELAEEGAVGYVPPELVEDDEDGEDEPVDDQGADEDVEEFDDDVADDDDQEIEPADEEFDDDFDSVEESSDVAEFEELEVDAEPADGVGLDKDAAAATDAGGVGGAAVAAAAVAADDAEGDEAEGDAAGADRADSDAADADGSADPGADDVDDDDVDDATDRADEEDYTVEDAEPSEAPDVADAETETDEQTDADEPAAEQADEPAEAAPEEPRGRVIPGRDPSIVDSVSSQGYTIVRADDEELSGISIVEENPGGSAGSIEIRRSAPADSGNAGRSDESSGDEEAEEGDTPEEDR